MVKGCALIVLVIFIFICAGCETGKGIACGASTGIVKDTQNSWQAVKNADQWVKDNLW